jgi:hypothetical protein
VNPLYPLVANRAGHRCEYCHAPEVIFNFAFEVEHILPRSVTETDELDNLALSCRACNVHKRDCLGSPDPETQKSVRLFNPRIDHWNDHFLPTSDGRIQGLTAIGRATLALLQINSELQLTARQQWLILGIYP